jgi:glutamate/tyrosine decarboxylase-like PLP-dependent enzyme
VRKIAVDERFAMRPEALDAAISADLAAGARPICVIASLGTTGVGAMDPLRAIGEICRRNGVWLHVDAAWAGSALVLPEHRGMLDGIEHVDSFVFNPHKWMFTNFDCSAHFVRDPEALIQTLEILPEFLKTRERSRVIDYRDWSVPLGRRQRLRGALPHAEPRGGDLRHPLLHRPDRHRAPPRRGGLGSHPGHRPLPELTAPFAGRVNTDRRQVDDTRTAFW